MKNKTSVCMRGRGENGRVNKRRNRERERERD